MSLTKIPPSAIDKNRRALAWYDEKYEYYDSLFTAKLSAKREEALCQMIAKVPVDGLILEIGSASGRDADFVERRGHAVRRTDITRGFIELQANRGKHVDYLDILTSDYGGPYDAIFAMCVFLHVAPEATDAVLERIAAALKPRGVFLVSVREVGEGDVTAWSRDVFAARLTRAGLEVIWDERDFDGDQWIEFLAQRR